MARFDLEDTTAPAPRAILVGVDLGNSEWTCEESLAELARLADTYGAEVVGTLTQRLKTPVGRTYIGAGKVDELVDLAHGLEADLVIFDNELTPAQGANLEDALGKPIRVMDRTELILEIFSTHATTNEGRLQVELAQLEYQLPRLRGMRTNLIGERTRGGAGSFFGQGESQLEVDRRVVRARITTLKGELEKLERQREVQSKARWGSGIYRVALAGYTNAGKSTLLNLLTGSNVYAEDELFGTLDPTTRALELAEGRRITITDTVGFIQKLPTNVVEAFKSTLAEVRAADLILIVVDAADPHRELELKTVRSVLADIDADDIPSVVVLNKCDLLSADERRDLEESWPDAVLVSALEGRGIRHLLYRIAKEAQEGSVTMTVLLPYDKGSLMNMVHERCQVMREQYDQDGLVVTVKADARMASTLAPYELDDEDLSILGFDEEPEDASDEVLDGAPDEDASDKNVDEQDD